MITTIIPCYNHGGVLRRAVESVVGHGQAGRREVIVVDDGSIDDTARVCAELSARYQEVRVIRQPNGGLSNARNTGMRAASGDFLHFLDADDYIEPFMYRRVATAFAGAPLADIAYCGYEVVDRGGGPSKRTPPEVVDGDFRHRLLRGNIGPVHSFVLRRRVVDAVGFFDENLRSCEDWDYWLRAAFGGYTFLRIPEILVYYERHSASMSRNYPVMLANARTVLANARQHAHGAGMEDAHDAAAAGLRQWFFDFVYAGVLETNLRAGRFGPVVRELARLVRFDARSAGLYIASLAHHKRATVHGLTALACRTLSVIRRPPQV